jgi:glucose-1-phosphate thymidylyltransferase
MKGVLICIGNDARLAPLSLTMPRHMIPVAGIPIAEYAVSGLVQSGIKTIGMVVGENRNIFINHFKDGRDYNCRIKYIHQSKPLGLAHALLCARDFIDDDDFVLVLGDNYFDFPLGEYISTFKAKKLDALLMTRTVENPWDYCVAELEENKIIKVVEKPQITSSDKAVAGVYLFSSSITKAASRIKPSVMGEYEIADAIQYMIDRGYRTSFEEIKGNWVSVGRIKEVLECNRYALSKMAGRHQIDSDAKLIDTVVGDNVSIGKRCIIKDCSIYNSIVMDDCILNGVEIYDSIIASYSVLAGSGCINGVFGEGTKLFLNLKNIKIYN